MPGMTHVQPAQPVLLAHHLLAYVEMLERDRGRFRDAWSRADRSPLGAGALAGAGFALDRESVATELGFGSRDGQFARCRQRPRLRGRGTGGRAVCLAHLSRLAEELVWWSSPAFGWVSLDDAWSTGSSMMPNKKNPDPAELIRGRAGRVIGQVTGILATLKGLPLGYQRDLQETVAPLLEGDGRPRVVAAGHERRDRLAHLSTRADASGSARWVSDRDLGRGHARRAWRAVPRGAWRRRGTRRRCGAARLPTRRAARRGVPPCSTCRSAPRSCVRRPRSRRPSRGRVSSAAPPQNGSARRSRPLERGSTPRAERGSARLGLDDGQAPTAGPTSRCSGMPGARGGTTWATRASAARIGRQQVVDGPGLQGADDGDFVAGVAERAARAVAPDLLVEHAAVDGREAVSRRTRARRGSGRRGP